MKRFYETAAVLEGEGEYSVTLDGRSVRTPAKRSLKVPYRSLAEALATEWQTQRDEIDPSTMPLTRLVNTTIDRTAPMRDAVIDEVAAFGRSDLLCYRAEGPEDLVERQAGTWQPLIDWLGQRFRAPLVIAVGITPVDQPKDSLLALYSAVAARDDFALTGLQSATEACGSLVLGLALAERRIDARTAFECAALDELYQAERWGEDPEAASRRAALKREISAAERFLALVSDGNG